MEDGNWTVVVGRRASKLRSSLSHSIASDASKPRGRGPKVTRLQTPREDQEYDEALLLLKVKRSMARVQESTFFQTLLEQVQSPPVLNHLHRAASPWALDVAHDVQRNVPDGSKAKKNLGTQISVPVSSYNSEDLVMEMRSSTEKSMAASAPALLCTTCQSYCDTSKAVASTYSNSGCNHVKCDSSPKTCSGTTPFESAQSNLEMNAAKTCAETFKCKICISMECASVNVSYGQWNCRQFDAGGFVPHVESLGGLTRIDETEGCIDSPMKKTSFRQITEKPWCLHIVLYGLGSIADSEISRCQFALVLLLKQRFSWVGDIEVFDPVLSESECKVIADMGCLPIAVDEKGRRSVSRPTLFYMPHCEDWLYDNVLQANWVPHTLGQLVILGNSFRDYQERWSAPIGGKSNPLFYVVEYEQVAEEIPLKTTSSPDLPGFNNMSWHFYPPPEKGNSLFGNGKGGTII